MDNDMIELRASVKLEHPDAIILCRINGCYRAYDEDADACAKILNTAVHLPISGHAYTDFFHSDLEECLSKIIRAGKRAVIIENLIDPKKK